MNFSIILPVRNGGEYVKLCVNSILSQTITNFNLIVLDNCSTDGTSEYIQSLNDERIIIYRSSTSLSIEDNWARIVGVNKNEFVTIIGHDDILFPGYLAEMERLILAYPKAGLYQTHFTYIDAKGDVIRKCKPMAEVEDGPTFLKKILQNNVDLMGTGFMMRSKDFNRLGGMQPYPNLLFADLELWLNLTDISFKVTSLKECFSFRLHQSTTAISTDLKFQQAFEKFIYFLQTLKQKNKEYQEVIENYSNEFLLFYCKGLSHRLLRTPVSKRSGLSIKIFLEKCKHYSTLLSGNKNFNPTSVPSIFIAKILDSSVIGRLAFLFFKKMYKKPVLK